MKPLYRNVHILDNLLLQMLLNKLRDRTTRSTEFRTSLRNAGFLMTYEIIGREAMFRKARIKTTLGTAEGLTVRDKILQIMVMRAGEPFAEGGALILDQYNCKRNIGVIDARRLEGDRNNFLMGIDMASFKVPAFDKNTLVVIYDPMLATGSTLERILMDLRLRGEAKKWILCTILSTPYGIERIGKKFSDVVIYALSVDRQGRKGLNSRGYIVPGLGDCGDRAFGNY